GLFGIRGMPEEARAPILLVEAPRLIFPFARQVVADAVANAGFPPLLLDPIDFAGAYINQVQAAQQQSELGGGNGSGEAAPSETPSEA
ncbi:MAG: protein-export chaperone SecB, partial [Sphingomicrobium sp.]